MRPPKPRVDPWRAQGVLDEIEREAAGAKRTSRTVFLTGAECPFTCVFCDLWRFTTDDPTPRGAIPRQLETALADLEHGEPHTLKLYNASNFFDERAVPVADHTAIARLLSPFQRVVVECHPRLVDERCLAFRDLIEGDLEIALGLETVHPRAMAGLNKQMTLEDYETATAFAHDHEISTRTFVLIGAPGVPAHEATDWIERSVRHAIASGTSHVALIPVRAGNGALEELSTRGEFSEPDLGAIEEAFAGGLTAQTPEAPVSLDLWDLEAHAGSPCCSAERVTRLREMEASGRLLPPVECARCEESQ